MVPALRELASEGRGVIRERHTQGKTQKRLVVLSDPNLKLSSGDEIARVDWVLQQLEGQTASELSERTHQDATWRFARDGETINPNAFFISDEPITEAEKQIGFREAKAQSLI